jgi:lipopolysaccharide export system permease protein
LEKSVTVPGDYDNNEIHMTAQRAIRKELKLFMMSCEIPPSLANGRLICLEAKEAEYIPSNGSKRSGGWLLSQTKDVDLSHWTRDDILEPLSEGKYFLRTDLDFDRMTRERNWFQKASTWQIFMELNSTDSNRLASMACFFHLRLTRPLLGMILVVMGLSVILRDQNRNVFISAGFCMVLGAMFYALCMAAKYVGDQEILAPALAAWLPVFLFGPLGFVLFDAVHT